MKKKNKYLKSFFTSAKQLAVDQLVIKKGYAGAALNPLHFCDTATEQSVFLVFLGKQCGPFKFPNAAAFFLRVVLYLTDSRMTGYLPETQSLEIFS